MRESAAAWGAALNLIPSLGPVIEGYLQKEEGKRLIRAIKDPQQQEFFIQSWQQSAVFKSFFGDEESPDSAEACDGGDTLFAPGSSSGAAEGSATDADSTPAARAPPFPPPPPTTTAADGGPGLDIFPMHLPESLPPERSAPPSAPPLSFSSHHQPVPLPYDAKLESMLHPHPGDLSQAQDNATHPRTDGTGGAGATHTSLSDIVARDAARSYVEQAAIFKPPDGPGSPYILTLVIGRLASLRRLGR